MLSQIQSNGSSRSFEYAIIPQGLAPLARATYSAIALTKTEMQPNDAHVDLSTCGYQSRASVFHLSLKTCMKSRIMYIERKAGGWTGDVRIGRVSFSKTVLVIYYRGQVFHRITGGGFKSNYYEKTTREDYWISSPKRRGGDRPYGSVEPVLIDMDVRREY